MRVLIIGGTGLISVGIVKHLLDRGARVSVFNRGNHPGTLPGSVDQITGNRNDHPALLRLARDQKFDAVIDMVCFSPNQAESAIEAFAGKCGHFIFCSTVCTYGVKVPPGVLIDETFPQEPISEYGKNKLACEQLFLRAHESSRMPVTIIRPSSTYGPGGHVIDNLEFDPVAWDRIERGLPVLCSGDGLGLWVSTHRDDCGKLFAHAAMNPATFGQAYNATRDEVFTWRDLLAQAAAALGRRAKVIFMPAGWIVAHDPGRFTLLREITQFHGAYDSSKAKRDVTEFRCEVDYRDGVKGALADLRRRNVWRSSADDGVYEQMVQKAQAVGIEAVEL